MFSDCHCFGNVGCGLYCQTVEVVSKDVSLLFTFVLLGCRDGGAVWRGDRRSTLGTAVMILVCSSGVFVMSLAAKSTADGKYSYWPKFLSGAGSTHQ